MQILAVSSIVCSTGLVPETRVLVETVAGSELVARSNNGSDKNNVVCRYSSLNTYSGTYIAEQFCKYKKIMETGENVHRDEKQIILEKREY